MSYFVKMLGASDLPMPNEPWGQRDDALSEVRFPPRPVPRGIAKGDELVYYAVGGWKRIFATARVDDAPRLKDTNGNPVITKRWPYAAPVTVRPETKLQYVSSGPLLEAVAPSLQQQVGHGVSHFEIGRQEFDRAVRLLRQAKAEEDRKIKTGWRP